MSSQVPSDRKRTVLIVCGIVGAVLLWCCLLTALSVLAINQLEKGRPTDTDSPMVSEESATDSVEEGIDRKPTAPKEPSGKSFLETILGLFGWQQDKQVTELWTRTGGFNGCFYA